MVTDAGCRGRKRDGVQVEPRGCGLRGGLALARARVLRKHPIRDILLVRGDVFSKCPAFAR